MDDFIRIGPGQMIPINKVPPETQALLMQAEVMTEPDFLKLLGDVAKWKVQASELREITKEEDLNVAVEIFNGAKDTLKGLEVYQDRKTTLPKLFVKYIRGAFKPFEDDLEVVKGKARRLIDVFREKQRKEAAEAEAARVKAAEAAKKAEAKSGESAAMPQVDVGLGMTKVQFEQMPIPMPGNVMVTASGSVGAREVFEVEVVDLERLVKAIMSKDKRWAFLQLEDLVEIKMGRLREIAKDHKIPGVRAEKVKRTV